MKVIVTYIKPGDERYAHIQQFSALPRKDELICIGGFDHQWWRVMEVIHLCWGRELERMVEAEFAIVVEPVEALSSAFIKKSDTR